MADEILHWILAAAIAACLILAVREIHATGLNDCPIPSNFAAQAQHDCTVWAAMQDYGEPDHAKLEKSCNGPICTYREPSVKGAVEYWTPYGVSVINYVQPYYGETP